MSFESINIPKFMGKMKFIEYDFSNPQDVFKLTLAESVVSKGIDQSILYNILQAGQIVIINEHPESDAIPWMTTSGILVNAPPDQVYNVIRDVPNYTKFMPQSEKAVLEKINQDIDQCFYELGIKILFVTIKIPYSVYHYNQKNRVDWIMAAGDFKANYGAFEVVPVPENPSMSMLFFTCYSQPRHKLVNSMFTKYPMLDIMINLSSGTLVVKAMKNRAESIFAEKGGKTPEIQKNTFENLFQNHPTTLAKLAARGSLLVIEDSKPIFYCGGTIVKSPMEKVFKSLRDLEGMSSISKDWTAKIIKQNETSAEVKMKTIMDLTFKFESDYIADYTFEPPDRISYIGVTDSNLKGVAGSYELFSLGDSETLVFYRNTSDLKTQGFMMRKLLNIEPTFELAIQASQTKYMLSTMQQWCER
ncbi:MAG: hypothetical protein HQK79_04770 [Desulfobacterales bacterium]|nr:hypothetical protein [Desulfobacterales bacterium]MBF0397947.1 hypothetical protein [Desulfobacterales bacterium]